MATKSKKSNFLRRGFTTNAKGQRKIINKI